MSRGHDGPEIDDFRGSSFGWGPNADRDPSSCWNSRLALHNIHREEERADRRDSESRERGDKDRPPVPREEGVREILSQRVRTKYTDRNNEYSLRDYDKSAEDAAWRAEIAEQIGMGFTVPSCTDCTEKEKEATGAVASE